MWLKGVCLQFNAPAVTWGQLSRASCEGLPPPASSRRYLVYSVLTAPTAPSPAALTPRSNCCEQTNSVYFRAFFFFFSFQLTICKQDLGNLLMPSLTLQGIKLTQNTVKIWRNVFVRFRVKTYFSLNTSNLRLSLSFSSSLLCWGQKLDFFILAKQKHCRKNSKSTENIGCRLGKTVLRVNLHTHYSYLSDYCIDCYLFKLFLLRWNRRKSSFEFWHPLLCCLQTVI